MGVAPTPPGRRRPVLFALGTRPEAIKLAPVVRALGDAGRLEAVTVTTGQHAATVDQVLQCFEVKVHADLAVMGERPSLADTTTRVIDRMGPVLDDLRPAAVVVQGDTTSAFAAALAAFYARAPVVHLEAGLRTHTIDSPFPEEANRRLITPLARLHLAPTPLARANLVAEGVPEGDIVVTGNTVIDALHRVVALDEPFEHPDLRPLDGHDRPVVLVTAHRRESWGEPLRAVAGAVADLARAHPAVEVVLPLHANPLVQGLVRPVLEPVPNVTLVGPLPYGDLARLLHRCTVVLTDSGGIQEEAPSLGKPVLVLRDTTERVEGIEAGTAKLVGTDPARIVAEAGALLTDPAAHARMAAATNPYGDGHASERAVAAIEALVAREGAA